MGLYDRDYMREPREENPDPSSRPPPWIPIVAIVVVIAFLLSLLTSLF